MRISTFGAAGLLAVSLILAGCGGSGEQATDALPDETAAVEVETPDAEEAESDTEEAGEDIEVDEGLLSTEVRIPLSLFTLGADDSAEPPTQEEIQASLDEEGRNIQATVNDDGTVTYRMSRGEFNRFKTELKSAVDESIQQAINEEANIYKSVTYSDDMSEFEVVVDRSALENSFSFFGFQLLFSAGYFQAFTGVDESKRFVLINYVDEKTGEVFDTYDSRELQEGN